MKHAFTLALLLATALPASAWAQQAPAAPAAVTPAPSAEAMALGQRIAERLVADGSLAEIMGATMGDMMPSLVDAVGDLPVADIAAATGASPEALEAMDKSTLGEISAILDPHWRERAQIAMEVMSAPMNAMMAKMEAPMRAGLARAYAAQFSVADLRAIDAFFATPAGGRYASKAYQMYVSPEVMTEIIALVPEMMSDVTAQMATLEAELKARTAHLPEPRNPETLTPEERRKLDALLPAPSAEIDEPTP